MPSSSDPVPIKRTFSKLERERIFQHLKPLGSLEKVLEFINGIESLLLLDAISLSSITPYKEQNKILDDLLKTFTKLFPLMESLGKICFDDLSKVNHVDLQTVVLIQDSLMAVRMKNEAETVQKDKSHSFSFPFNYPTALIDDLFELRDAVDHAAKFKVDP